MTDATGKEKPPSRLGKAAGDGLASGFDSVDRPQVTTSAAVGQPPFGVAINRRFVDKLTRKADWSTFNDSFENLTLTAAELAAEIQAGHAYTAPHRHEHTLLDNGRRSAYRHSVNFVCGQVLSIDSDTGTPASTLDALSADPFIAQHASMIYTTASHTPEAPRARVVFVLDQPIMRANDYAEAAAALVWKFSHVADSSCKDAARLFYGALGCDLRLLGNVLPLAEVAQLVGQFRAFVDAQRPATRTTWAPSTPALQEVAEALRCIPARLEYHEWLRVLMGVHAEYPGADGVALCESWSPGYPGEVARKFKSFSASGNGRGRVGIGTVYRLAQQNGWQKPARDGTIKHHNGDGTGPAPAAEEPPAWLEEDGAELAASTGHANATPSDREAPALPFVIVTNRHLPAITADALEALEAGNNPPVMFVRAGGLARVRQDERGRPLIDTVNEAVLCGHMVRTALYYKVTVDKNGSKHIRHVTPPDALVRDLLALGQWSFPALDAITEAPSLRPDGTVILSPGYDRATGLYYVPSANLRVPTVPDSPTVDDLQEALALIDEAIGEFPYADAASRANAVALLLTPIVRPAIDGNVPLALIDKPQAGTGGSLLAEAVALIATGRQAAMLTQPDSDEEWRKVLTAALMEGATMITIDNVEATLQSANLAAVLTSATFGARILGQTRNAYASQRATWLATGNNLRLGGDMPRRCYWIRLDAQTAQPWRRKDFKHPGLIDWVKENRGRLLAALLTLCRAWYAAGKPPAQVTELGSFESWARTIGGILDYAGIVGFLGNLDQLYERADEEGAQWAAFLTTWHDAYGAREVTVADLVRQMRGEGAKPENGTDPGPALADALPDTLADALQDKHFQKRLGKALSKRVDMTFGEGPDALRLRQTKPEGAKGGAKGVAKWHVVKDHK